LALDPSYYDATLNDIGAAWCQGIDLWDINTDLGSPGSVNPVCLPTASADFDPSSSFYTCDSLQLVGTDSTTPDGTTLTYDWELTSAPGTSTTTTADITETSDSNPTFIPDVAGVYTFTLTVNNGFEYSLGDSVSVTITDRPTNTDPISDAGPDQSTSASVTCTSVSYGAYYTCSDCDDYEFELDATGSSDPDSDQMSYSWAITDNGSYATIVDETTTAPTVTMTGVGATYGSTNTVTVEVTLTATDCMGATNTDTIDLSYACTGS